MKDRTQGVPQANVVLVRGVERITEPPEVVGTVRIPEAFYTGGCADGRHHVERLLEHLGAHAMDLPELGDFLGPREGWE